MKYFLQLLHKFHQSPAFEKKNRREEPKLKQKNVVLLCLSVPLIEGHVIVCSHTKYMLLYATVNNTIKVYANLLINSNSIGIVPI